MKIVVFLNELGLGGTGKAATRWARGLVERGHQLQVLALEEGPRRYELESFGIEVRLTRPEPLLVRDHLRSLAPEIIHVHAPGHAHRGDVLGTALGMMPKIPLLQTNIFGQLRNPRENSWTDFRLFISWTSCVQAARRVFRRLNAEFFKSASVASYPLDPVALPSSDQLAVFRERLGIGPDDILFGRLSRPEPNKWTDLLLHAFRFAAQKSRRIKLLLREAPPAVAEALRRAPDRDRFVLLPATSDEEELRLTMASLEAVLHTSVVGESFGYGIAEPMNLGKPVVANSTPWGDQAQIELVRHGECGFIASTPDSMAREILRLADDEALRCRLGINAKAHIRALAEPAESITRLEDALRATAAGQQNLRIAEDLLRAKRAASYLERQQYGHGWREQLALRPFHYRVRFSQLRQAIRSRAKSQAHESTLR